MHTILSISPSPKLVMPSSLSTISIRIPYPKLQHNSTVHLNQFKTLNPNSLSITRCKSTDSSSSSSDSGLSSDYSTLKIGSAIMVVEAPQMIKTAASVPCLRVNDNLVKAGDVGRIVARKPMDVWAVRLAIGTYLLDGKYFRPLVLDE